MVATESALSVVLIEDHDVLRAMIQQALEQAGHSVTALSCAEALDDVARGTPVDVFLIDLNLPGEDGLSLTDRVRCAYPLAGLIIITARTALHDKLEGYARGADLYLTKPFEVDELCAAVQALGRRRARVEQLMAQQQNMTLSQQRLSLQKVGSEAVSLSAAEVAMLAAFSRAPSQRLAYWQLAEILGVNLETQSKASMEVRIVRLRKKLISAGAANTCIEAIRGEGYQLLEPLQVL